MLLSVDQLCVSLQTNSGKVEVLKNVSLDIAAGETLGIVGESGCGKTMLALAIMGLLPKPGGKITSGEINFMEEKIDYNSPTSIQNFRGREVAMIFQEPMTSLNPVLTIGSQILQVIRTKNHKISKQEAEQITIEWLDKVGLPNPQQLKNCYPHQLSGGMRQRVMIAMALSCNPKLIIADEPTTALDVTVQHEIMQLLQKLQSELNLSIIIITHDMGIIAEITDRCVVMYAGKVIEYGLTDEILGKPAHPYTNALIKCIPPTPSFLDASRDSKRLNIRLEEISGTVPAPGDIGNECVFYSRCKYRKSQCETAPSFQPVPTTNQIKANLNVTNIADRPHLSACYFNNISIENNLEC